MKMSKKVLDKGEQKQQTSNNNREKKVRTRIRLSQ
jgi:hypothetical protein